MKDGQIWDSLGQKKIKYMYNAEGFKMKSKLKRKN